MRTAMDQKQFMQVNITDDIRYIIQSLADRRDREDTPLRMKRKLESCIAICEDAIHDLEISETCMLSLRECVYGIIGGYGGIVNTIDDCMSTHTVMWEDEDIDHIDLHTVMWEDENY